MPPLPDELDSWLATCACKKMLSEPPTETNKQLPEIQYAQIFFFFFVHIDLLSSPYTAEKCLPNNKKQLHLATGHPTQALLEFLLISSWIHDKQRYL